MTLPVLFVTALALVNKQKQILLAQRPEGKEMAGLWEFPGGKIKEGEPPDIALVREIKEELDINLLPENLTPTTFAAHNYPRFHLFMPLYLCRTWQGDPHPMEGQKIAWVSLRDFSSYPMPPADAPLAARLEKIL